MVPDPTTDQGTRPGRKELGKSLAFAGLGFEMVTPMAIGVGLDLWLNILPWCTVVGVILGFGGGMFHLFAMLKILDEQGRQQAKDKQAGKPASGPDQGSRT